MLNVTKFQIMCWLFAHNQLEATIGLKDGRKGIVQSVEREDGSGYNFNITVSFPNHTTETFYVRTID